MPTIEHSTAGKYSIDKANNHTNNSNLGMRSSESKKALRVAPDVSPSFPNTRYKTPPLHHFILLSANSNKDKANSFRPAHRHTRSTLKLPAGRPTG